MGMRPSSSQTWGASYSRTSPTACSMLQILLLTQLLAICVYGMTDESLRTLRQETRDIFYHGFDNYMEHAFPEDELRPLTCGPLTRDRANPAHIELNDVLGNYSLTLIDSLSTLAILASAQEKKQHNRALKAFEDGIVQLVEHYGDGTAKPSGQGLRARGFDLDSKVQVFETVIRGVGGLLSAHLFAVGDLPIKGHSPTHAKRGGQSYVRLRNGFQYEDQLLNLARDLAQRLLPAFQTPTGLPYPRVNLRYGATFYASSTENADPEYGQCPTTPPAEAEITETCSAGAGSLVLEFTTLSRLTGDPRFEEAAKRAFWAVWDRRSSIGLIGAGIDAETGQWVSPYTGIGAGIDSFFEYALKSHILLSGLQLPTNDTKLHSADNFLSAWQAAHGAIYRHIHRSQLYQHPQYVQADVFTGAVRAFWIDSLSAYYPGLLTLAGELDEAIQAHLLYTALWTRYSALPERWSTSTGGIEMGLRWWGGRPEFIESTWYIYRATRDPWYLHVGEMALRDIKRRCWTKCGWAGLQDIETGELNDRMESFFLGETVKYLYLLFDASHPLNHMDDPMVFTTEGHPLVIPSRLRQPRDETSTSLEASKLVLDKLNPEDSSTLAPVCPLPPATIPFSISATAARGDVFHAASLARLHTMPIVERNSSSLVDFTPDHPSISLSDLHSPSNYTFYPWTLPLDLVPPNGMSSRMFRRPTFDLSFPNMPDTIFNLGALQRTDNGILVSSMSGLRLGMILEPSRDDTSGGTYRIQAVSNVPLGRDENVFLQRSTVAEFSPLDPFFTRIRDTTMIDLLVDTLPEPFPQAMMTATSAISQAANINMSMPVSYASANIEEAVSSIIQEEGHVPSSDPSFFSALFSSLQKMLLDSDQPKTAEPDLPNVSPQPRLERIELAAALPTGIGATPVPDTPEPPVAAESRSSVSRLVWQTVHVADSDLCDHKLSAETARTHNVIVIRRGGCSFSTKLQNIPAVAPSAESLKLVIVVSSPEYEIEDDSARKGRLQRQREQKRHGRGARGDKEEKASPLIQPLLDVPQLTPAGLPRPHLISMVMARGGDETIKALKRAKGIGVRRRLWFSTQGIRIGNLIVL